MLNFEALCEMQDRDGCFPSRVAGPDGEYPDRNGFTTALVLQALRDCPESPGLDRVRAAALDFIERCRSTQVPGAFGFWPEGLTPAWAPHLPPDLDDTALMTIELMRYGRLTRLDGLRTVCKVLLLQRVAAFEGEVRPHWVQPGAFKTWVGKPGRPNLVDCCVNVNAAALMAFSGAKHLPGYEEAVETVRQGIAWAGDNRVRQQSITPFYPSFEALRQAIIHAIDCGVDTLRPALVLLQPLAGTRTGAVEAGCCCSAYGGTIWRCHALDLARSLRAAPFAA